MKIAVLSGKGGTGKTFVASNIAAIAGKSVYLDCDIEEPNGHLFLKGPVIKETDVNLPMPKINHDLCDACRKCVDFCAFNALAMISEKVTVFEKICHSCGGCKIICPQKAITEVERKIGKIEERIYKEVELRSGVMTPGEQSGTKIIDMLIDSVKDEQNTVIIDCPPGSACTVMDSIEDADYCILVAEPTTFGAHNLKMVHKLVQIFDKPHGIILNKSDGSHNPSKQYCLDNSIPILLEIPWRRDISDFIADGKLAVEMDPELNKMFKSLLDYVKEEVQP